MTLRYARTGRERDCWRRFRLGILGLATNRLSDAGARSYEIFGRFNFEVIRGSENSVVWWEKEIRRMRKMPKEIFALYFANGMKRKTRRYQCGDASLGHKGINVDMPKRSERNNDTHFSSCTRNIYTAVAMLAVTHREINHPLTSLALSTTFRLSRAFAIFHFENLFFILVASCFDTSLLCLSVLAFKSFVIPRIRRRN